ncbi:alpha/beta fold hydrolase [Conexibacter sp. DBS9H8]|uniref:alpha/beta fold hydrolase n=1 Tax=Conexibacter sp. DBS9H8 TaxID=2937801 RepID=UPI00200D3DB5|nr:alpha/beta hydrolase [Conexibacter sp. DBS9H8]
MRLRLHHHRDGARIAYRERGTGRPLVLLHSLGLSHREWEPIVAPLADRFRVILPDLPLHGDSEDRPRHPYTGDWFAELLTGFCAEVAGSAPLLAAHDFGAEIALTAIIEHRLAPAKLVLMDTRMHHAPVSGLRCRLWRSGAAVGVVPGLDLAISHAVPVLFGPRRGDRLSAAQNPASRDLLRHAVSDVAGNANRARAWAKFARHWQLGERPDWPGAYAQLTLPVLLLWAEENPDAPLAWAADALELFADAQLRTVPGAGFLAAYDEPVVLARELIAFLG